MRILLTCKLHATNPRDLVTALAESPEIDLYILTDSKNYEPISSLEQDRIYHFKPTWPVLLSRFYPPDKWVYRDILSEIEPDILLSMGVSDLVFMASTADFSPSVLLPQGGEMNSTTRAKCKKRGFGPRWVMYKPLMWELLRHVDEVWSCEPNRAQLRDAGLPPGRFRGFDWDVVDAETFHPDVEPVEFADEDTTVIGSFRRIRNPPLIPSYETFLDAAGLLQERREDFHLVIGGYYQDDRGQDVEEVIEEKIAEHELDERVIKVDMVPKGELPRYYGGLDVYVNNSPVGSFAGIGGSAKEGMASGCAFVTFNEPSAEYVVDQGENGFLVHHGEPKKLADVFDRLCSDPEYRQKMGDRARQTAVEQFSADSVTDRIEQYCREIIK